ncbi:MAG: MFS transporter [Thermomicrobiales bacterium]
MAATRTRWVPLAGIVLAVLMLMLDATVTIVALPAMARDLGGNLTDLQWVMNAYTLAMAGVQLTAGTLADRFGRRRLFLLGIALFAVASLACGFAPTVAFLIVARVVQGVAGAFMFATTLALIGQTYTGAARGTAFAVRGTTAGIAVVLGPVVGALLVHSLGWRWIFFVNLPIAAVALAIGWTALLRREPLLRDHRIDIAGPILLALSLVSLVFALLSANEKGWTSPLILTCLIVATLTITVFFILESRLEHPILDFGLFKHSRFVGTQIGSFTVQGSVFGLFVYLSVYFQNYLGYSVIQAGLAFLPLVIPIMVAGSVLGTFFDRIQARTSVGAALLLIAVGLGGMLGITPDTGLGHLVPGMIAIGLGCGIALPVLGSLGVDVSPHQVGMASGINNTALQLGFTLGISLYGAILGTYPTTTGGYIDGLNRIILIGALWALIGAVLGFVLLRTVRHRR